MNYISLIYISTNASSLDSYMLIFYFFKRKSGKSLIPNFLANDKKLLKNNSIKFLEAYDSQLLIMTKYFLFKYSATQVFFGFRPLPLKNNKQINKIFLGPA